MNTPLPTVSKPIPGHILIVLSHERAYQELKWPGHDHSVAEWLLIMEKLMQDARRAWVTGHGDNEALHEVRQVVATGIACMEQCGAPMRGEPLTPGRKPFDLFAPITEGGAA